ncbi:MAG TPA: NapC/NirT family cytochrome c [Candidatus Polarisedimenticolaceae bacterium]|nr:NapC/NirT family cytochrome c [Candidatus Polarisedimenticolaceae bacterium]
MTERHNPFTTFFHAITRNGISLAGAALTTASALLFLSLFTIESLGFEGGPYLGIVNFVVVPALFVLGLVLIPVGLAIQRRRTRNAAAHGQAPPRLPIVDLNVDRTRAMVVMFSGATMLNLVILAVATYKAVEVMDTTKFCGASCHSVMAPEYTTYQRSPHSRVACVSCHIGPGAGWFVKSKLSGSWQLISVNLKLYPKPIPTPVHNLRPARDTCEQCHWPTKFVGDRLRVITHYAEDEPNTETKTVVLLKVGGLQGRTSRGIHWHVDPGVRIRYRSDEKRETIGTIELTRSDGTVTTYAPKEDKGGEWRTMDCLDCHNRPSHIYRMPEAEIDRALAEGALDKSVPFLRREGLKAIKAEYASQDEARQKIAGTLEAFYGKEQPSVDRAKVDAAAHELGNIYATNVWPSMNIKWGTYPSHLGHTDSPGCFRCHDGEHADPGGRAIPQDCDLCHTVLAQDEPNPEVLKTLQP